MRNYKSIKFISILCLLIISPNTYATKFDSEEPKGFRCQFSGKKTAESTFSVKIHSCRARGHDTTDQAINGRVFQSFQTDLSGDIDSIKSQLATKISNHIQINNLNPSSSDAAQVFISNVKIADTEDKKNVQGQIQGILENFTGKRLPITNTDEFVLDLAFNMGSIMQVKRAVLSDLARISLKHKDRFATMINNWTLNPIRPEADRTYVISLGGGHGSKAMFDILESYHNRNPNQKVLYRTTDAKNLRWRNSTFPNQWQHQITEKDVDMDIEYFVIPESLMIVYRMNPSFEVRRKTSNYGIITPAPSVYRASFSTHQYNSPDVTNHWGVSKKHSTALKEVLREICNGDICKIHNAEIEVQDNWSKYSDKFSIKVKKLAGFGGPEPTEKGSGEGMGGFIKSILGNKESKKPKTKAPTHPQTGSDDGSMIQQDETLGG